MANSALSVVQLSKDCQLWRCCGQVVSSCMGCPIVKDLRGARWISCIYHQPCHSIHMEGISSKRSKTAGVFYIQQLLIRSDVCKLSSCIQLCDASKKLFNAPGASPQLLNKGEGLICRLTKLSRSIALPQLR